MASFQALAASGAAEWDISGFHLPLGSHRLSILPWAEATFAIRLDGPAQPPHSPAAQPPEMPSGLAAEVQEGGWRVSLPRLALVIKANPLSFSWQTPEGTPLWGPVQVGIEDERLVLTGALEPRDAFYGLGEKPGYLNKRGRAYGMWNTDNNLIHAENYDLLYQSIPWLITHRDARACGFLFDDPGHTHFDLGFKDADAWRFVADGPVLRLFAVGGPHVADVVRRYSDLTGRMPLPPRWALGYQQSRWSYPTREDIERIAAEFRTRKIPADVLHFDIDYMDGYRVFTWSEERFPRPAELIGQLRGQGFQVVTIVDPGVKQDPDYEIYNQLSAKQLYVRLPEGSPYIGEVWPGPCLFPDFLREQTRRWWGDRHTAYTNVGVAGIWNDMNEPSVFHGPEVYRENQTMPAAATFGEPAAPIPHAKAHNLYGYYMSQATREGLLRQREDTRPFVISRAGYAGIQRHAMVWTGDNHSLWSHLEQGIPMCLNMSLSGVPFVGPDVGGFAGDCSAELLERWCQLGIFTPFFRNHSAKDTRQQEPWAFGPRTEAICRDAIEWRYRLLPYLYTCFWEASETGMPMLRPLVLTHPEDPETANLHDQFFFGPELLVAPITRPGATHRLVYFPAGRWLELHSHREHLGPGYHVVSAPPDTIPTFVRAGALLPLGPVVQHTGEPLETLRLELYPAETLAGRWYDDDGETFAYQRGGYNLWRFEGRADASELRVELIPEHLGYNSATQWVELALPLTYRPRSAKFDGLACEDWREEGDRRLLKLPLRAGVVVMTLG